MGKHSKNSNDRAFFSYHERKAASYGRLSSAMLGGHNTADGNHQSHGWGTMQRTLDGDAMKEIDACSLSLQACVHPVVTENGILYDKQVIVEYILSRKKVIPPPSPSGRQPLSPTPWPSAALARQVMRNAPPRRMTPCVPHQELERELHAWEAQEAGAVADAASEEQEAQQVRIDEFVAQQEGLSYARPARTHPCHHHGPSKPQALTWPCCVRRQSDLSARTGKTVATASTMGAVRRLRSATTGRRLACTGPPANRARAREGRLETRGAPQKRHTDWFDTPRPFAPFV